MKHYFLISLTIFAIFITSCHKIECDDNNFLSDSRKQLIPYTQEQTVNFINSLGENIALTVIKDTIEWIEVIGDCDRAILVESRNVELQNELKNILMQFYIDGEDSYEVLNITVKFSFEIYDFWVRFNENDTFIDDSEQIIHKSITINNKIYYDVVESTKYNHCKLFYNKEYGIIQLKKDGADFLTLQE